MKNLPLGWKLAILVGSLLVATALVALTGLIILHRVNQAVGDMVDGTAQSLVAATRSRNQMLRSVLAERAAAMDDRDRESQEEADKARDYNAKTEKFMSTLESALELTRNPAERRMFDEFKNNWLELMKNQKKTLELSVQNTNAKALAILNGDLGDQMTRLRSQLNNQVQTAQKSIASWDGKDPEKIRKDVNRQRLSFTAIGNLDKLRISLNGHVDALDDTQMNKLDGQSNASRTPKLACANWLRSFPRSTEATGEMPYPCWGTSASRPGKSSACPA